MARASTRIGRTLCAGVVACAALSACDSLFGIDVYPAGANDGGGTDSSIPVDATSDTGAESASPEGATPDAAVDSSVPVPDATTDAPLDATTDGADEGAPDGATDAPDEHVTIGCTPNCNPGDVQCVGGQLQSCAYSGGCFKWAPPVSCGAGETCWGSPGDNDAYCCAGGPDVCAPSCQGLVIDAGPSRDGCGPMGQTSCCTTLPVTGGTFYRSYDGVTNTDMTSPAKITDFDLDAYEVTVGRFRNFVIAWDNGFRPADGSGLHSHLNGGQGLVDSSGQALYEPGWNKNWSTSGNLGAITMQGDWDTLFQRSSCGTDATWTVSPGPNENKPINCVDWYMAYAFCIWDGGFLPSEAEWNYAAAGGGGSSGQRVYAWSSPSTSETIDCTYATYGTCSTGPQVAGLLPKGNGRYGQSDLTGNEWEWTLDYFASYVTPCQDCAYTSSTAAGQRTIRGESFSYTANQLYVANRDNDDPTVVYAYDGFRCARP